MRIHSFSFQDRSTGWQLEETTFDPFNLLVGVSGVGKTKILRALEQVRSAIQPSAPGLPSDVEWTMRFEHEGHRYRWHAVFVEPAQGDVEDEQPRRMNRMGRGHGPGAHFQREEVDLDDVELVRQDGGVFRFKGADLPKLNPSESALALLSGEAEVARAATGLKSVTDHRALGSLDVFAGTSSTDARVFSGLRRGSMSLPAIQQSPYSDIMLRTYMLQEALPEQWRDVRETFASIFPTVEDLRIARFDRSVGGRVSAQFILLLRERGASDWIVGADVSGGMRRVLATILGLRLTPPGSVILIDEFENSLGKNCLPALVDLILESAPQMQFIITSHHPYVINNIPISEWKLVQRRGSAVRVRSARDVPALQRASHFDAFDRLLNLPEFDEGIT
ncbi:AAA family ATPase [Polyangium mundeleinium]|uniref:AAA family ATPase n=1 Tax=Polyangium mundeleinium TaxID=2995306 RepID=A0ABT5F5M4_9BACT|nr:AAA family ATPase [Polyangium mundeleinium]MDC0748390.1 AAA family ATPase [Polyangium mundeleinium]